MLRASLIWKNVVGTFIVFVIGVCLFSPWPGWSNATTWWAVSWGFVGAGLHLWAKYVTWRREKWKAYLATRPPPPRAPAPGGPGPLPAVGVSSRFRGAPLPSPPGRVGAEVCGFRT